MSPVALHNVHLTITQAQHAAALDDLLRQLVYGDELHWNTLPKTMHKVQYKDRYEQTLKECGSRSKKTVRVENVEKFFNKYDYDKKKGTAGMPHSLYKELISIWKLRSSAQTDAWNRVSLHADKSPAASGSSTAQTTTRTTRATTVCAMVLKKKDGPIPGMAYIVIVLDPLLGPNDYDEAGIDPSRLFRLKKNGAWNMILGTGCAVRPACTSCWNVRAETMGDPVYATPALLRDSIEADQELFMLSNTERHPCSHPLHDHNIQSRGEREIPLSSLIPISAVPTLHRILTTCLIPKSPSRSTSARPSAAPSSEKATSMPPPLIPAPSSPQPIAKLPRTMRPNPPRPRKLDMKIHHQVIRARILIGAKRLTARLQQETYDVSLEMQQIRLELDKQALEVRLAQARFDKSSSALTGLKTAIKKERQAMKGDLDTVRESLRVAEENVRDVTQVKDGLQRQYQRSQDALAESREATKKVQSALQTNKGDPESARKSLEEAEQRCRDVARARDDFQSQMTRDKKALAEAKEANKRMEKDQEMARDSITAAEGEMRKIAQERDLAQGKLREEKMRNKAYSIRVSEVEADLARAKNPTAGVEPANGTVVDTGRDEAIDEMAPSDDIGQLRRLLALEQEHAINQKKHYDGVIDKQHETTLEIHSQYEAELKRLKRLADATAPEWADAGRQLDVANARIKELETQLADADRASGQVTRELNRLREAAAATSGQGYGYGGGAPGTPGTAGMPDMAVPRHLRTESAGPSRPNSAASHQSRQYSPYPRDSRPSLPLISPPMTSSPAGSPHPSQSSAYFHGFHYQTPSGHTMNGSYPPLEGGQQQTRGVYPQVNGVHHQVDAGRTQNYGGYPHVNGDHHHTNGAGYPHHKDVYHQVDSRQPHTNGGYLHAADVDRQRMGPAWGLIPKTERHT